MASDPILWRVAPLVFAATTATMILLLPLFPNHDGPVHVYYAHVIRSLLTHTGPYAHYFAIKSYITPYSLEYYSLAAFESFFSPLKSEELLICCYVIVFILGFRRLVGAVTGTPGPWVLAAAPFCLNCYVYLGILNFAFGTALAMFLCGSWLRWQERLTGRRIAYLFAGLLLIALTHPVPTAVFLLFVGIHLVVSVLYDWIAGRRGTASVWRRWQRPACVLGVMGLAATAWVSRFIGHSHPGSPDTSGYAPGLFRTLGEEFKFWVLAPQTAAPYRAALMFVTLAAAAAVFLALWKWQAHIPPAAISLAVTAALCLIARCVAPESANGSRFFRERFSIFWVVFLLVLPAALKVPRWCATAVGVVALTATATVMLLQWSYLSRTARDVATAIHGTSVKPGSVGVIVADTYKGQPGVPGDPFFWAGAHFFSRSDAILTNAVWLDLEVEMLRPKLLYPWTYLDPDRAQPKVLQTGLAGLAPLNVVVVVDKEGPKTGAAVERLGFRAFRSSPQITFYSRP